MLWEVLKHPTYILKLLALDFYIFGLCKKALKFTSNSEVQGAVV
jgi:hypothetical protein